MSQSVVPQHLSCMNTADEICELCGLERCARRDEFGRWRPHDFEVRLGTINVCKRCNMAKCDKTEDGRIHCFEDHVCKYCNFEQCPYFADKDTHLGTHDFDDSGKCKFCGHYQCSGTGNTHKRSVGNCCIYCFKELCDDTQTHVMSEDGSYCTNCLKYFGCGDEDRLCTQGRVHRRGEDGRCSICDLVLCGDSVFSCRPVCKDDGAHEYTCEKCKTPLCIESRNPHLFVEKKVHGDDHRKVAVCATCNKYKCTDNDVHMFNEDGVCKKCSQALCKATGGVHVISEVNISGRKLKQCLECGQYLCEGNKNHLFENGQCKTCGGEECSGGNVHIFSGSEGKCILCECTKCHKAENKSHRPAVHGDRFECEHCHDRFCSEAIRKNPPLLTTCKDDGSGLCRFCRRGLCTDPESQQVRDHEFHGNVCEHCNGSKCTKVNDGCHSNENGYCIFCGIQLCRGNSEHNFQGSAGHRICRECKREECMDGKAHSLWKDGCCEFCRKELCSNGKQLHQLEEINVSGETIKMCSVCHCEACEFEADRDRCHELDLIGKMRCIKCLSVLCVRKKADGSHISKHYFNDQGICGLCGREKCGDTDDVHHRVSSTGTCHVCHVTLCKNQRRHEKDDNGFCRGCLQELCPSRNHEDCHEFDRDGKCVHCNHFQCQDNGYVHRFIGDDGKELLDDYGRVYCRWCHAERCDASANKLDVCHFVNGGKEHKVRFCVCCLNIHCPQRKSTEDCFRLSQFCHKYTRGNKCEFCASTVSDFEKRRDEAREGEKVLNDREGKSDDDINKARSSIQTFANILNNIFKEAYDKLPGNEHRARFVVLVSEKAVEWLEKLFDKEHESDLLNELKKWNNPRALYRCYELAGDSEKMNYLQRAAVDLWYSPSVPPYLQKKLPDGSDLPQCRDVLRRLLRGAQPPDVSCLIDVAKEKKDKDITRMLLEHFLMMGDNVSAWNLFDNGEMNDGERLKIVKWELKNGNSEFQSKLAAKLLSSDKAEDQRRGGELLSELVRYVLENPTSSLEAKEECKRLLDSLTAEKVSSIGTVDLQRIWCLHTIQKDFKEKERSDCLRILVGVFRSGDHHLWYDMLHLIRDHKDSNKLNLFAHEVLIKISTDNETQSYERTISEVASLGEIVRKAPAARERGKKNKAIDNHRLLLEEYIDSHVMILERIKSDHEAKIAYYEKMESESPDAIETSNRARIDDLKKKSMNALRSYDENPPEFMTRIGISVPTIERCIAYLECLMEEYRTEELRGSVSDVTLRHVSVIQLSLHFAKHVDPLARESADNAGTFVAEVLAARTGGASELFDIVSPTELEPPGSEYFIY